MALILGDNFSYGGSKPLDARLKYSTTTEMKAVADSTMYDGCLAYCTETDKTYQWKSTNEVDTTLGRWREFSSGGGGGTSDYSDLTNKPQIEGVTLSGNKSASDLGLATESDIPTDLADLNDDATHRLVTDAEKNAWNGKSTVGVTQVQSSGTKIATVNVNGTDTDLYAPSGGGGSSDYNDLDNKPSVEGVTLSGNKTASDLGLDKARELTAAQYAALSEQEKMNGTTYFVTDGQGGGDYSIKKRVLETGETTVSLSCPTTGDYVTNIYTSDGRDYLDASVSSGTLTITFEEASANVDVYVEFRGV